MASFLNNNKAYISPVGLILIVTLVICYFKFYGNMENTNHVSVVEKMNELNYYLSSDNTDPLSPDNTVTKAKINFTDLMSFVHMDSQGVCENIFTEDLGKDYEAMIDPYYDMLSKEHDNHINELLKTYTQGTCMIGSSKNYKEETYVMWQLARLPFVKTVCETGFNAGYSTHLWLHAKPDIHVYSFDIGHLRCAKPMASILMDKYPGRLNITWGDSTQTLPKFIAENPSIKCDLMVIDGGHVYKIASQDHKNFQKMASSPYNIVFLDNYPDFRSHHELARTWEEGIRNGDVAELFRCHYKSYNQGFTFGRFII